MNKDMPEAFGWLNFSAADMKRAKEAIAELKSPGSIDELGISIIRDGFADKLFPGLNVMQTSLKYYVLIPAMLQKIEKEFHEIKENEDIQVQVLQALIEKECIFCDKAVKAAPTLDGIIGKDSAGQKIYAKRMLRFPHSIFWHGIDLFGLMPDSSSLRSFCEGVRTRQRRTDNEKASCDKKSPWGEEFTIYNSVDLNPQEPINPLALSSAEYSFLKKKMLNAVAVKDTALEILLKKTEKMPEDARSALEIREKFREFGETAQKAAEFGVFMRCAFLAYNIAYQMYCCSNTTDCYIYYDQLYELHSKIKDLSIPLEFPFHEKKAENCAAMEIFHYFYKKKEKTCDEMKNFCNFLKNSIPQEHHRDILNEIQDIMTKWEKAAGKKVCHLKDVTTKVDHVDWIGMEFLDFRYNTAVKLFANRGNNHGHDAEAH